MPTLYVATTNPGKLGEFTRAAASAGARVLALPDLAAVPEPVEDAPTFAGNADIKARAYSTHAPGLLVLADDSGLEVDALDGRPGVLSARFADSLGFAPDRNLPKDERNVRCLLALLAEKERAAGAKRSRRARFVCALTLAQDGQILLRAEGSVAGDLLRRPRGANGFGYDPLFLLPDRGLTLAELAPEDKWAVSHRGKAFRNLLRGLSAGAHLLDLSPNASS